MNIAPSSRWPARIGLLVAMALAGVCVGIACGALQAAGVAVVGLQSLAAGALLGVLVLGAAHGLTLARVRWPAVLLAAVVAIFAQHYWLYASALEGRRDAVAREPAAELFRPGWSEQSFVEYMRNEATTEAIALWALDACLLTLAAVVIVEVGGNRSVARAV